MIRDYQMNVSAAPVYVLVAGETCCRCGEERPLDDRDACRGCREEDVDCEPVPPSAALAANAAGRPAVVSAPKIGMDKQRYDQVCDAIEAIVDELGDGCGIAAVLARVPADMQADVLVVLSEDES